jgi:hypothetical protein
MPLMSLLTCIVVTFQNSQFTFTRVHLSIWHNWRTFFAVCCNLPQCRLTVVTLMDSKCLECRNGSQLFRSIFSEPLNLGWSQCVRGCFAALIEAQLQQVHVHISAQSFYNARAFPNCFQLWTKIESEKGQTPLILTYGTLSMPWVLHLGTGECKIQVSCIYAPFTIWGALVMFVIYWLLLCRSELIARASSWWQSSIERSKVRGWLNVNEGAWPAEMGITCSSSALLCS